MERNDSLSRRSAIRFGGVVAVGLLAGCTEGGSDPEDDEDGVELEEEADDADPPDEDWDDEWGEVDTIELDAEEDGWIGRRPSVIEDVENPDIALYEGREYEIVWTNTDGSSHNFAVADENTTIETSSFVDEESETTELTFEATAEIELYLCETHPEEMTGSIEMRSE
ncbi:cupredoxin domain-containing protein [Natronolimnohabitans innermongolicus]|nr:hypothetical protein [Natronolimnohabitans innermongolicus]